ncbi:TMEM175 family protein [Streptomyces sp. URMC 124]|uniref:TMEM175 family protein n=1 Tax=Streptomyces sp. URMC 124 TaxID=3423405 RepID=UPI003F1BF351
MSADARPEPGLSPERLAFFTDAIFAIAMTLLAVELEHPDDEQLHSGRALGDFLVDQWGSYLAFALAFALLWSVWRRHHQLMDRVRRLSKAFAFWHAPFLLLVAFLPFPTTVIGASIANPTAQTLFAGTMAAMVCCEATLKEVSVAAGLTDPAAEDPAADDPATDDRAAIRHHADASWSVGLWFALSAALAWLLPYAYVMWFLAPLAATYGAPLLTRLRTGRAHPRDRTEP